MAGNLLGSIVPGLGNVASVIVGFVVEIEIGILHGMASEWENIIEHIRDGAYNFGRGLFG